MKIAYVGNFSQDHCTEVHIKKTLESLGHTVIPLQEDVFNVGQIYEIAKDCSLFLYTKTWGLIPAGNVDGNGLLEKLKNCKVPTASYHLDLYWGISREAGIANDPFWKTDFVFTPDGGHDQEFRQAGINHYYLKPGVFDQECYLDTTVEKRDEVLFVGSYNYHSEWGYRQELLNNLAEHYGGRFMKYGNGGGQFAHLPIRGDELNKLYASTKVVVGDSLCKGFNSEYYWSDRVYETLGRGGFLIHPYIKGLDDEFTDKKHLVFYQYGKFSQLYDLIDYYLEHDDEREKIRLAGHNFVKKNATYKHRVKEMLTIIKKELDV
jgi:hypothetical protein